MRYLGIDFGTKRIGLALSDEGGVLAFPDTVVANTPEALGKVKNTAVNQAVGAIVMGDSRNYEGQENTIMTAARVFAEQLAQETALPVFWHTEVLTSRQARREGAVRRPVARMRKNERSVALIDASAAALMLQSFLDTGQKRTMQ